MISARLTRLRELLRESGLDGFCLTHPSSVRYITGFTGSHALCVVTLREAAFFSDARYREQARLEVRGLKRIIAPGSVLESAASSGVLKGLRHAGFESAHVTYAAYRQLRTRFPSVRWHPTSEFVERLAMTKTPEELALVRSAVRVSEQTLHDVLVQIRPGVSERDLAAEVSYRQRRYGGDGDAFEPLIGSGERSALPHPRPTDRKFRRGDCVVIDIGCTVGGYNSDITRTFSIGGPSKRLRQLHAAVLTAQQEALDALRDDIAGSAVDAIARRRVEKEGYGRFFPHSLGHGLGMAVHERPRLAPQSTDRIRTGNVVTVEPGIYLPGECGVRIEDDVVVTGGGARMITTFPRALLVI